ncbi:MAG: GNAT family N-acetyltransferase [Anaerolineales bacterium]|nr:GNAT family N-acetyltransferase [Anaerolineales bacterium]
MLILETARLILRPFQDADLEAFASYRSDPQVAAYQGWEAPYSLEQAKEFIETMKNTQPGEPGKWYQLALEQKSNTRMIGDVAFCILSNDPRQAEIGITLAAAYQGKGYAGEALERLLEYLFNDMNLHRVRANCDLENRASSHMLENLGFRQEGVWIESLWFKGRWSSELWYAMLQREWHSRWLIIFEDELRQAQAARQAGNEGKARVCARRAAGIAVGEYFRRKGIASPGVSAYDRLRALIQMSELPPGAAELASHLLLKVNERYQLPIPADLAEDARQLAKILLD